MFFCSLGKVAWGSAGRVFFEAHLIIIVRAPGAKAQKDESWQGRPVRGAGKICVRAPKAMCGEKSLAAAKIRRAAWKIDNNERCPIRCSDGTINSLRYISVLKSKMRYSIMDDSRHQ